MKVLSVREIIENVEGFRGTYVYVQGLLPPEFEGDCIIHYPKHEMKVDHYNASIYISPAMNFRFEEISFQKWSGKMVIAGGTVFGPSAGFAGCGHMSAWPAEMVLTQIDLFGRHFVDSEKT